jgi:tetratricopeptide (TPR) repeat protein
MNSLNAPADARKAYQKALDAARKRDWRDTERLLQRSIELYPSYAEAWEALGRTQEVQANYTGAKASFQRSIDLDPKFVTPQLRLMVLAGSEQNWSATDRYATAVTELDPFSYPLAFYLKAMACLHLNRRSEAEEAARRGLRIDVDSRTPRLNQLLGALLLERGADAEAVPYLKAYLASRPEAGDAGQMNRLIAEAENRIARQTPTVAAKQRQ